ncbi:FAD-binding oxidoreductase [Paraburkholderia tagetis]|uniref:FAD-binding oxidoreductase n=1 Tax=Paraburkholderia tagetis TaxID=2913261 RepID=A0A9X1UJJ2_9BURK|nr:FAD-binding oxidoreductase [Paraburkholderia tagetis]MCG5076777.1 FAD-binding oxidoreductase [Paraburkholderia tagetis]
MEAILNALKDALGADAVRTGSEIESRYLGDWSAKSAHAPLAVVLPRNTQEVAAALRLCNALRQGVVPQGGLTGLAGGAVPTSNDICISLERLAGIEEIDRSAATMTVRAGTTLQAIQEAAEAADFEFQLDLGARGTCQIGGNLATNAGGIRVIQSGTARDQVLGLEVVLADGSVLSAMGKMIKNNTGYDLRHLFIGSEGTLGIITRAVLRLAPRPAARHTALCALSGYESAIALLQTLKARLGKELSAFELMWPDFFELGVAFSRSQQAPFSTAYPLYALIEHTSYANDRHDRLAQALARQLESGLLLDAVIAQSTSQARSLWEIREATAEFPVKLTPINFDISIPIGDIGNFVDTCRAQLQSRWPASRAFFFGHIGDSNLHVTVDGRSIPGVPPDALEPVVYDLVRTFQGSVSAEHGIGVHKRPFLGYTRSETELACMRSIKRALDPNGILNPGKLFS